jgi:hypothetical protein
VLVAVAAAVWLTRDAQTAAARFALIGMVAVLVACALATYPRSRSTEVRLATLVGITLTAVVTLDVVLGLRRGGAMGERVTVGVPLFTLLVGACLVAYLRAADPRSGVRRRALRTGIAVGLAAAAGYLAIVLVVPPMPATATWGVLVSVVAGVVAGVLCSGHEQAVQAGLVAALTSSVTVVAVADMLMRFGPTALVPDLVPAALTSRDNVAQSRIEAADPYVLVLALGFVAAAVLIATSLRRRPTAKHALAR